MPSLKIPHNAYVFVGDGRKALFLRNEGDEKFINLKTEDVFYAETPMTHELGSDKPGSVHQSAASNRSSYEQTDWHELEEQRFVRDVTAAFERLVRDKQIKSLVIVAPPRSLAELRKALHADVKARVIAEIDKDLTKEPVYQIEKHLVAA